jgi:hypothetical protein
LGAFQFTGSIDAMHASAAQARGLDDFGDPSYRAALEMLCRSLDEDASLTPIGEFALQAMIGDALQARLLCEAGHHQFPEARSHQVTRPLVIIGLPRTGTTALHHLIAQDPKIQALEHWLERAPKPRPSRAAWSSDEDFLASAERVRMIFDRSPEMKAIHEMEAHLPDECWNLFAQNFAHSSYEANAHVPSYASWWASCDMTPVYRRHLRNVQLIGHREPEKRWLFKDATHLFDLDALLEVYPDACIIQTHRDPVSLIPSVCSLCWTARGALNENMDQAGFGRSTLELWHRGIDGMMQARARQPAAQFYDLPFERIVSDPIRAISDIYDYFDIEFTQEAESAMRDFREQHPKDKHGSHQYSLEEWSLDESEIRERFGDYMRAHDLASSHVASNKEYS